MSTERKNASEWTIHGERVVDDTRRAVLSIADVELPDGTRFEQYVLRVPAAATVVVLDENHRVLLMRRHRFILNQWVWELPGGYLDIGESAMACAAREVEEETGWRPRDLEPLVRYQPMVGTVDQPNIAYLARRADHSGGSPDINEAAHVDWIALDDVEDLMRTGEIVGAGSVSALLAVLLLRERGKL